MQVGILMTQPESNDEWTPFMRQLEARRISCFSPMGEQPTRPRLIVLNLICEAGSGDSIGRQAHGGLRWRFVTTLYLNKYYEAYMYLLDESKKSPAESLRGFLMQGLNSATILRQFSQEINRRFGFL